MMVLRVLIIGLGSIGKLHLSIARSVLPGADIRILSHRHHSSAQEGADGFFFELDDALKFEPNLSIICNPAPFHIPLSLALAKIGSHLLIEKPLSDSLEGVFEFVETCKSSQIIALVGYNLRFLPSLKLFRELIKARALGHVLSVRIEVGQYLPNWRSDKDYQDSVSARKDLGGGVLLELSHELDYLRWIFGEVAWVNATLCKQSKLLIDVEDTAHLTLGLVTDYSENDLVASVSLDFIRQDTVRVCTAICESGSYRWDGVSGIVSKFYPKVGKWENVSQHIPRREDTYRAEWEHLLNCIKTHSKPSASIEDGMKVMQIIDAIRISSINGRLEKLKISPS